MPHHKLTYHYTRTCIVCVIFVFSYGCSDSGKQSSEYDAVARCIEMWDIHGANRYISKKRSRVLNDRVIVSYTEFGVMPNVGGIISGGQYICALDSRGRVGSNRRLCIDGDNTEKPNLSSVTLAQLIEKFPWVADHLREALGSKDSIESIKVLGDLNGDGVPELVDTSSIWCGMSNCGFPIYSIDASSHTIAEIGGEMGIDGEKSILLIKRSGWNLIKKTWCAGHDNCYCYIKEFDRIQHKYLPTERYLISR